MKQGWSRRLIVLVLAGSVASFFCYACIPRDTPDGFRSRIKRDIPIGTERSEVENWLKNQGLAFTDTYSIKNIRKEGLQGKYRKYRLELIGETTILFSFSFDEDDKLTSFSVREFHLFF